MVGGRGLSWCGSGQSKLRAVLNMTMYLQVPKNLLNFLTELETIGSSVLFHGVNLVV
jgi:hypothetical protein